MLDLLSGRFDELVAACERASSWPGPIEGEVELRLPPWAFRVEDEEDDVESIGLVA